MYFENNSSDNIRLTRGARDHVAEPSVAHAGRKRRTGRGHVAGGHASTRVYVGARVGCHVAGEVGK